MAYGDFLGFDVDNYYVCIPQHSACAVAGSITYCYFDDGNYGRYVTETCQFFDQNCQIARYTFSDCSEVYYSDAAGGYSLSINYCPYGYLFCSTESGIPFPDGNTYTVGIYNLIADGNGNRITSDIEYCVYGKIYYNESYSNSYIADGSGYYLLQTTVPLPNVSINWQPSKDNINKYFCKLDACGQDLFLNFSDSKSFYLINSICDTNILINETSSSQSISLDNINKSFLYIKNNGVSNLIINSSYSGYSGCWNYLESGQAIETTSISGLNYLIRPQEEILFNIDSSADGSKYLSKACFPFGYYYEFCNTISINPSGFYPVICNNGVPTYFYQDICNYENLDQRFRKLRSFNFSSIVDCNSCLRIDFSKFDTELVCLINNVSGSTLIGGNQYDYCIYLDCVEIFNDDSLLKTITDFQNDFFETCITSDCNIYLNYSLSFNQTKYNNYYYISCASQNLSQQKIKQQVGNSFCYINESVENNCLYKIKVEKDYCVYVDLNIYEDTSIKSLNNCQYSRDNLYLPVLCDFNYQYNYRLADSNYTYSTGRFLNWTSGLDNQNFYTNCVCLISCSCQEFLDNKPSIYKIDFTNCESRYNSNNILNKPIDKTTEEFALIFSNQEESIYYSGLEFRYFPVTSIVFNNVSYDIPDECVDYCVGISGKSTSLCFPIRALNYFNLKIINDYETVENLLCSNSLLNYGDFALNLSSSSNNVSICVPVIRTENLSGYQHPSVTITNNHSSLLDNNMKFYINPVCNFYCDRAYELNNLFLFISSELNNGIVTTTDFSSFTYKDSDYNFLLIDAEFEFKNCNFKIPTGCSYLINQVTKTNNITYQELLPYKNITGNGYNYILPIQTGLKYTDCFITGDNISNCRVIEINANLNYLVTGRSYTGGSPDTFYLFDVTGGITGSGLCSGQNSSFLVSKTDSIFNLPSVDLTNSVSGRCIILEKLYTYSGIQPINICSNYGLLDIRNPLICNTLQQYSENISETCINDSFYYVYNIANPLQKSLKFLSPEGTFVNYICWSDQQSDSNSICFVCLNGDLGQIQGNAALINFSMKDLFFDNAFEYNCCNNKNICINIIGGI